MATKRFFFLMCMLTAAVFSAGAQTTAGLKGRINQYLKATSTFDIDNILDLTYPRVFEIASKVEMKKLLGATFNNKDINLRIDSVMIDTVYPVFTYKTGQYAKLDYAFVMRMGFKSDTAGLVMAKRVLPGMRKQYGAGNVRLDEVNKGIAISRSSSMAAIKNDYSKDWTFMEIKEGDPLTEQLLNKDLLIKFGQY